MKKSAEPRDYFTFFRSFYDAINLCEEKDQIKLYKAIINFAIFGNDTDFTEPLPRLAWIGIKPTLKAGWNKYKAGKAGNGTTRNAGNKNAAKQNRNKTETKQNQLNSIEKSCKDLLYNKYILLSDDYFSLELKQRKDIFWKEIQENKNYDKDTLTRFYAYWSETDSQERMRFEKEEIWNTPNRLATFK